MADVANPQTVDTINIANMKTIAETLAAANANLAQMAAQTAGLQMQNAAANQANQMNSATALSNAITTQAVNKLLNMDPSEAVAVGKVMTGNDVAQQLNAVLSALASGQQGVKTAQTTPPVTS